MACPRLLLNSIVFVGTKNIRRKAVSMTNSTRFQHHGLHDISLLETGSNHSAPAKLDPFAQMDVTKMNTFIDDIRPPLKRSFNLAAYVNTSETLQELVKLGVSLFDIENTNTKAAKQLIMLDFRRNCAPYIMFLVAHGLKQKNLGRFISEFPDIFQVPIGDLEVRIKYLKSKGFSNKQIASALNRSSRIILHNIKTLDYKLGEFQVEFRMPADIIRSIVSKYPPIISLPNGQYKMVNFTLREEFGFTTEEIHTILEHQPKILDILRPVLIDRVELVHNMIGISHKTICQFPKLLTGPVLDIRRRFSYLKKLNRNQFDPRRPLYVPPSALYNGSDEEFCRVYAKTNLDDYITFLKYC